MTQLAEPLEEARQATARQAWRPAYERYAEADPAALTPQDIEGYGNAAWWTGHLNEAVGLRERAYTAYAAAGEEFHAARMALTLSWDHQGRGAFAVAHGWLANAERRIAELEESPVNGFLALTYAITALFEGSDLEQAIGHFEDAYELGKRFRDRDIQVLALTGKGRALVMRGDVEEGLALLDESTAAAVGGELDPYSTGLVYCMTISSCHDLGDYRRAAEWTEEASRWCDRLDVTGFPGACRIHRAEILRLRGDLEAAERQAVAACEELHDFERYITANGYYEIGEIRRRRGDHAGADEAYATADELGRDPQPGLAQLRLAQGKLENAVSGITRSLADTEDPLGRLKRLPARVEIAVAAGDLKGARAAASELEDIVEAYKIGGRRAPAFEAQVRIAQARIELAERDWNAAVPLLREARDIWRQVGAPYETAQARQLLALAFRRGGDEEAATAELEAAATTFARLGAKLDEERAQELLGRLETRRTFLFSDIVDSTRLLETLGDEKWQRLLHRHDELVREQIAASGGQLVKHTGDGVFASFDSPKAAVEAAVGIQRALADEIVAPDVRIGVHTGVAFATGDSATDFGGQGVHTAARIGAAAAAREILISSETLNGVATAFSLSDPRSVALKGIKDAVDLVSIDWR